MEWSRCCTAPGPCNNLQSGGKAEGPRKAGVQSLWCPIIEDVCGDLGVLKPSGLQHLDLQDHGGMLWNHIQRQMSSRNGCLHLPVSHTQWKVGLVVHDNRIEVE